MAKAKKIAKEHGYLQYMIERYLTLWGEEETLQFIKACDIPLKTSIRLNSLKNPPSETQETLEKKGITLTAIPWLDTGFYANFRRYSPGAILQHMLGHYYVQGVPSMTVVEARALSSAAVEDMEAERIAASTNPINPAGRKVRTKLRKM